MFDTGSHRIPIGPGIILLLLITLAGIKLPLAQQRAETRGDQSPALIAGRDAVVTYGLTPEQAQELTKAAAAGAVGPLADRIIDLSNRLGFTQSATLELLRILGERDVPLEQLPRKLAEVADQYQRAKAQVAALNPQNPLARTLVEQAQAETKDGNFIRAHQLLAQAKQAQIAAAQQARELSERAQDAADRQLIQAAASSAAEGDLATTELRYLQAADLFKEAATLVPSGSVHEEMGISYLMREAAALYQQANEFGDNDALRSAIERRMRLDQLIPSERMPHEWIVNLVGLGDALTTLGARAGDTARLDEAITAYRKALTAPGSVQPDWAVTQARLGDALTTLGARTGDTVRLEEAVVAYRAALLQQTSAGLKSDSAATQARLGIALSILGEKKNGVEYLKAAIIAYRAALTETTSNRGALEQARTQIYFGKALFLLGELDNDTGVLEEAVAVYRAALTELVPERGPLEWGKTQIYLGNALKHLGEAEADTTRLEEAVQAYSAALTALTPERSPLDWAGAQTSLGDALRRLGERESGTTRFEEALAAYRAALTAVHRQRGSLDWAINIGNQGIVLMSIADRRGDPNLADVGLGQMTDAIAALRDGGHLAFAAFYETQLTKARNVVKRLRER